MYWHAFFKTMGREWLKIDYLRCVMLCTRLDGMIQVKYSAHDRITHDSLYIRSDSFPFPSIL